MGTFSVLRQSLRNLCHRTQWKYAVFWKLKHQSRMLLTWEDGYCVPTETRGSVDAASQSGIFHGETGIISFAQEINGLDKIYTGCPIELAVANMSCHMYSLGEGIIGMVAFTGKHRWIFAKSLDTKAPSEYPEEWQVQFAAGIQTILLVPVPHGVVQLGSVDMVMEDLKVVAYVNDLLNGPKNADDALFTLDGDILNPLLSPPRSFSPFLAVRGANEPIQCQEQLSVKKDLSISRTEEMTKNLKDANFCPSVPSRAPVDFSSSQDNVQHMLGMDTGLCIDGNSWKAIYNAISGNAVEESCIFSHSFLSDVSKIVEDGIPSYPPGCRFKERQHGDYDYFFPGHSLVNDDFKDVIHKASDSYFNFPIDSELHKALGSTLLEEQDICLTDTSFSAEDMLNCSFPTCKIEETVGHDFVNTESSDWVRKPSEAEHLLDAVISSFYASDDSTSNTSRGTSPSGSSGDLPPSCLTSIKCENDVLTADNLGSLNHEKSSLLTKSVVAMSSSWSPTKSYDKLLDEEKHRENGCEPLKRNIKSTCVGKKKTKGADLHKPRPRDRQLIQDRIKELRELVPNGSKCSIDALLDRTIKHMHFLQSISSQADKLKQYAQLKVEGEKRKPAESSVHPNGASWAYDLGNQTEMCPIVVENLDQPGHMLVEMLCNEYGLFLEIAQVIKHLELTILKGVMERRSHKLWAHFIVEASRGFHRMDILWPLMRLLQRQCSPVPGAF